MDQVEIIGSSSKLGERSKRSPIRVVKKPGEGRSGVSGHARPVQPGTRPLDRGNSGGMNGKIDLSISSIPVNRMSGSTRPGSGLASTTIGEVGRLEPNTVISQVLSSARQQVRGQSGGTSGSSSRSRPSSNNSSSSNNHTISVMTKHQVPMSRIKVHKQDRMVDDEQEQWLKGSHANVGTDEFTSKIPIPKKAAYNNSNSNSNSTNNNNKVFVNAAVGSNYNDDNNSDDDNSLEYTKNEPELILVQPIQMTGQQSISRKQTGSQRKLTNRPYSAKEISDMIDQHVVTVDATRVENYNDDSGDDENHNANNMWSRDDLTYFRDADDEDSLDGMSIEPTTDMDSNNNKIMTIEHPTLEQEEENVRIIQRVATGRRKPAEEENEISDNDDLGAMNHDYEDRRCIIDLPVSIGSIVDLKDCNVAVTNTEATTEATIEATTTIQLNSNIQPISLKLNRPSSSRAQIVLSEGAARRKPTLPSVSAKTLISSDIMSISAVRTSDKVINLEAKRMKLTHIPRALRECSALQSLDLSANALSTEFEGDTSVLNGAGFLLGSSLCNDLFMSFQRLNVLNLQNNRIQDISFLSYLPNQTHVNLNGNLISHFPNLATCSKIQELRLSHNAVETVGCTCIVPATSNGQSSVCKEHQKRSSDYLSPFPLSLTLLDLSHNRISLTSMHSQALEGLVRLEVLLLSSNAIASKNTLVSIEPSKLSKGVKPKSMKPKCFLDAKLPALAELDMSYNQLTLPSPLPAAAVLHTLSLNNNALTTIRGLRFPALVELYVGANRLDSVGVLSEPVALPPAKPDTKTASVHASLQQLTGCVPCVSVLEVLDASGNNLSSQQDIGKQSALTKLWEQSLSDNPISVSTEYATEIQRLQPHVEVLDEVQVDRSTTTAQDEADNDEEYQELLSMMRHDHRAELQPRKAVDLADLSEQFEFGRSKLGEIKKTLQDGLTTKEAEKEHADSLGSKGSTSVVTDTTNATATTTNSGIKRIGTSSRALLLEGLSSVPSELGGAQHSNSAQKIGVKKSLLADSIDKSSASLNQPTDDEDMQQIRKKRLEAMARVSEIPGMSGNMSLSDKQEGSYKARARARTEIVLRSDETNDAQDNANVMVNNLDKDIDSYSNNGHDNISESDINQVLPLYAKLHPAATAHSTRSETPVRDASVDMSVTNNTSSLLQRLQRPSSALRRTQADTTEESLATPLTTPSKTPNAILTQQSFKLGRKK